VVLVIVNNRQARLTRDSIRLAREEFIASHRPKIIIKHIWLVALGSNQPVTVKIVYANVGDAKAVVSSIGMDFNVINPDTQLPGDLTAPQRPYIPYPECGLGATASTNVSSLGSLNEQKVEAIKQLLYFVRVRPKSGTIDDVRIYNRALSAQEVQKLYLMGK
jgi:hypothetical protein